MKLFKIILIAFIVFSAVPSFSAEWVLIEAIPSGGENSYYDKSRITIDNNKGVVWIWKKYSLDKEVTKASLKYKDYKYSIVYLGINCSESTTFVKSGFDYSTTGVVIENFNETKDNFVPVAPDSHGEAILNFVCKVIVPKKDK